MGQTTTTNTHSRPYIHQRLSKIDKSMEKTNADDVGQTEEPNEAVEEDEGVQNGLDDSSEEEEEGSEEERAVREGFIADEDEEDAESEDEDRSSRKRKRKHRHRHKHSDRKKHRSTANDDDEDNDLDEDDLELLAENTGVPTHRKAKRRLRRAGSVASDNIDQDVEDDLHRIFDDEDDGFEASARPQDEFPEDEHSNLPSKASKRKDKNARPSQAGRQKQAGRLMGALAPDVTDITKESWDEVIEVFGNGDDYTWALEIEENTDFHLDGGDPGLDGEDTQAKSTAIQLKDIFEPSEIKERMLTEADEAIRQLDIPERTQLASAGLTNINATEPILGAEELELAAEWVAQRISQRCNESFLQPDRHGFAPLLKQHFLVAVKDVLDFFLSKYFEVPFVFMRRQDYINYHDPQGHDTQNRDIRFLTRDELWKAHTLALKYVALLERIQSVEEVADLMQWLTLTYGHRLRDAQADVREDADALAELDAEGLSGPAADAKKAVRYKKALRESRYERAKSTNINHLSKEIGISARQLTVNFLSREKVHQKENPPLHPLSYAETYCDPETEFEEPKKAIEAAKFVISTDVGRDPLLKKHVRHLFQNHGVVTVTPTESGMHKINELHPYFAFKYLSQKPFSALKHSPQYLQIMAAEQELLVNVQSDDPSDDSAKWNELREEILMIIVFAHVPHLLKAKFIEQRADVAPFRPSHLFDGESPRCRRFRDHMKLDNLRDPVPRQAFSEFLQKRAPDVIVVVFSASTYRLLGDVKTISGELGMTTEAASKLDYPVIVARDDTARLNQQGKRAEEEFGELHLLEGIALPRYVQSPLNEYAAAASDLTAISFHPDQQFLPKDTLQLYLERALQEDLRANLDPDILDDTRIHPEDYDVARKMAADAQELDEEDLTEQPPSQVVIDLLAADSGRGGEIG
ncbi:hypothetical protein KEM48_010848 [Puccinia striiformis f. sp. tritici PST-130]|nr:hypothetical protein KEM48_010848 [Puccinia striiformis f. sp. tritici PST-130]